VESLTDAEADRLLGLLSLPQPTTAEVLFEAVFYGWLSDDDRRWLRPVVSA